MVQLPIELTPAQAECVSEWFKTVRHVSYWENVDLSVGGGFYLTKATDGEQVRPHWRAGPAPVLSIFSSDAFIVVSRVEVQRFRVGLRMGSQGFTVKLTDGASRRLRAALVKAGEGSKYHFDYETQEAVITVRGRTIPLKDWSLSRKESKQ